MRAETDRDLQWRDCLAAVCTDIDDANVDIQDDDYFGFEVTGTGDNTELRVWDFDDTPPASRAAWGVADQTLTGNPNNAADVGKYVGLYDGSDSSWDEFDNFSAGDI